MKKFKLKSIEEDKKDVIKDVTYKYSIEDSLGLLEITQTMYLDIDPVMQFISILSMLYRIEEFTLYYKNMKYVLRDGNLNKIKMY